MKWANVKNILSNVVPPFTWQLNTYYEWDSGNRDGKPTPSAHAEAIKSPWAHSARVASYRQTSESTYQSNMGC